jgi:hypothetical protein
MRWGAHKVPQYSVQKAWRIGCTCQKYKPQGDRAHQWGTPSLKATQKKEKGAAVSRMTGTMPQENAIDNATTDINCKATVRHKKMQCACGCETHEYNHPNVPDAHGLRAGRGCRGKGSPTGCTAPRGCQRAREEAHKGTPGRKGPHPKGCTAHRLCRMYKRPKGRRARRGPTRRGVQPTGCAVCTSAQRGRSRRGVSQKEEVQPKELHGWGAPEREHNQNGALAMTLGDTVAA